MSKNNRLLHVTTMAAGVLMACPGAASAQWTPTERVNMVTHSAAGTGNELMLREIADIWNKNKLVPRGVNVEPMPGSQGEKARRYVTVQSKGNPHVLSAYTPQSLNLPLLINSDTGWRSFTPVAMMAVDPMVLVVNAESPWKTVKDLVDAARQNPKKILQGGGSYGSSASITGKMLGDHAGVSFTYQPYRGAGEAIPQLLGKHVQFMMENPNEITQHVQTGKMRALAATEKLETLPGTPTFAEAGVSVRFTRQFRGIMAPPGIAPEAARHWVELLERTRQTPQWREYVKRAALADFWVTGAELTGFLAEEEKTYLKLNKEMGLMK